MSLEAFGDGVEDFKRPCSEPRPSRAFEDLLLAVSVFILAATIQVMEDMWGSLGRHEESMGASRLLALCTFRTRSLVVLETGTGY